MGKQCASFLGWQQHDAQEFFSSLLDNLHEDLNQQCVSKEDCELNVNEKPDTAWNAHIKRNNSLIVKLFHGQLMSKVTCTACHKMSYSYDPCAQISLPIPSVKQCLRVLFFPSRIDAVPLMIPLQISTPNATIWHLLNMLQSFIKVLPHQIRLFSGLTDLCNDLKIPLASQFKYRYAIACEVKEENISLPVFQYLLNANSFVYCDFCYKSEKDLLTKLKRCTKCFAVSYCSRDCQVKHWQSHKLSCSKDLKMQVGIPFYINITRNELTFEYLESALKLRASVSVQFSNLSDTDMTPSNKENIPKCNILIKVSNKMNGNDDSASLVTKDNFSETILKGVCLIIEWQNCPEELVLTKEEPVCDYYKSLFKETPNDEEHCTLSDSLRLFMEPEKLDGNESWKCPKCKTFQTAKKEMAISLPSCLLLLHLKRFSYGEYGEKITKTVLYPLSNFDLAPFVCKESLDRIDYPLIYDLCGVISHLGTMRMGHYTCMTKMFNHRDQEEGGWRLFDDETATKVKPDKVISANAYVLLYRLRGTSDILKLDRYPVNTSSINGSFSETNQLTKKKSESASLKENSVETFTNKYKRSISLELAEDKKKIAELSPESRRCVTFFDKGNKARRSAKRFSSSEELLSLSNVEKMSFESKDDFGHDLLNFKNHTDSGFSPRMGEENNSNFHDTADVLTCDLSCTSLIDVLQNCDSDVNDQINALGLQTVQIDSDDKVFRDLINMDEDELD